MAEVLVVSDSGTTVQAIRQGLGAGGRIRASIDPAEVFRLARSRRPQLIFLDLGWLDEGTGGRTAAEVIGELTRRRPEPRILILANPGETVRAVAAVRSGAVGYLTYPLVPAEVARVAAAGDLSGGAGRATAPEAGKVLLRTLSRSMQKVFDQARLVAPTPSTVLLTGETGTGKGVLARLVHDLSARRAHPFVSVHCGAIPEALIESELFGHERGAFTGAVRRKTGRFEQAGAGTVFLDEIGTVTAATQIKLLQVLQDRTFQPVGGERAMESTARILAATNMDLAAMCARGEFRTDLFYRLNVFPVHVPPLRERPEDLPLLADFFIGRFNRIQDKAFTGLAPEVARAFRRYEWPGNVREMENLIERAFILERPPLLGRGGFPRRLFQTAAARLRSLEPDRPPSLAEVRRRAATEAEKTYLQELLARCGGRIDRTAAAAGVTPRQIHKLLRRHGLRKESFKPPRRAGKGG